MSGIESAPSGSETAARFASSSLGFGSEARRTCSYLSVMDICTSFSELRDVKYTGPEGVAPWEMRADWLA